MKLAIMTKSTFFVEEDKILTSLFDEGMDNLHLFKPGSSPIYSERLLTLLPEDYRRKVITSSRNTTWREYTSMILLLLSLMATRANTAAPVLTY